MPNERRGDWFCTASGRRVFVTDPDPEAICIEDIAHALSHLCRFGGHCDRFYSVAQHSVLVSLHVPQQLERSALLHDAAEAYIGDVIRPLKQELTTYKSIEARWESAIAHRFGVRPSCHPEIKLADRQALITERRDVATEAWGKWLWKEDELGIEPWSEPIEPLGPVDAREMFLERWQALDAAWRDAATDEGSG